MSPTMAMTTSGAAAAASRMRTRVAGAREVSRAPRGRAATASSRAPRGVVVSARAIGARGDDASRASFDRDAAERSRRRMMADAAAVLAATASLPALAEGEAVEEVAPAPAPAPPAPPAPKKAVPLVSVAQPVMAYELSYPSETSEGTPIKWATSRQRDTYSSAEPMSPDARQRIVYELISFKGPMTATVTVGPFPPKLRGKKPEEWKPKQVAEAVLADRATGRIATGQKVSLAEVEYARGEKIGDVDYVYYEYISQGSPNLAERESTTFRHSFGVTAARGEYLYTYTISAPETLWDVNAAGFEQGIRAFKLVQPNKKKFREPGNEGILPPLPF